MAAPTAMALWAVLCSGCLILQMHQRCKWCSDNIGVAVEGCHWRGQPMLTIASHCWQHGEERRREAEL